MKVFASLNREASASLGRFLIQGLAMALTVPVMVRELGPSEYGLWILGWSLFGLAGLFDLGFGTAAIKVVAAGSGAADQTSRNARLSTILALLSLLGLLSIPLVLAVASCTAELASAAPDESRKAHTFMVLLGLRLVTLGLPLSLFRGILYGGRHIVALSLVQAAAGSAIAIATCTALAFGADLLTIAVIHLTVMVGEHAVLATLAFQRIAGLRISWRLVELRSAPELLSFSFAFFLSGVASTVLLRTDPIIVKIGASLASVAAYGLAQKLAEVATALVKQLTNLMAPRAAEASESEVRRLLVMGMRLGLGGSGLVALPLVLLAEPLLSLWLGVVPEKTSAILQVLALALFLSGPQLGASGVLAMSGSHFVIGRWALASAGMNLALSLWWVQSHGVLGVAAATLAVTFAVDVIAIPRLAARRAVWPVSLLWRSVLVPLLGPGIVWFSTLLAVRFFASTGTFSGLAIGLGTAVLVTLLTTFRNRFPLGHSCHDGGAA